MAKIGNSAATYQIEVCNAQFYFSMMGLIYIMFDMVLMVISSLIYS